VAYTQTDRICSVSSALGQDVLLLRRMTAEEGISRPFRLELELVSEQADIDFGAIVGSALTVRVKLVGGAERYFNGVVSSFSQGGTDQRFVYYEAEVVPWLWLLTRRSDCRIFQDQSVPDIIKKVFSDRGFSDFDLELSAAYKPRGYCVQYRETDFNFVSRLMEEVGISYYFKHEDKRHKLVLFDSPSGNPTCPGQAHAIYASESEAGKHEGEILSWSSERELGPGAFALCDYNFESPSENLGVDTTSSDPIGGNEALEIYDYPGEYSDLGRGEQLVKLRMEAEEAASIRVRGESDCVAFCPGYRFQLKGHYRADYNKPYLLTEATHTVTEGVGHDSGEDSSYENSFSCMPYEVPFRSLQLTPKPTLQGVQTAIVVGPSGQEIYVDRYGRVKVQFHWDREGQRDDTSSCWIRVSQNWAGKNWGGVFLPRIGQEVIVDFLEGDPDRPIITGRVYNAELMVPYELPANATQSGIKSRSSSKGAPPNFNEIRFEDKKGSEEIFIQAERDMNVLIENNRMETVRGTSDIVVKKTRRQLIEADEHIHVKGARNEKVDGDQSLTVGAAQQQKVGTNHALEAGQEIHLKGGMKVVLEAGMQLTLKGPGGFVDIGPAGVTIQGTLVKINSGGAAGSGSGASPTAPDDASEVEEE